MSDAWNEIQAIKSKRHSLREKLEKRKKERQDILGATSSSSSTAASSLLLATGSTSTSATIAGGVTQIKSELCGGGAGTGDDKKTSILPTETETFDPDVEQLLLQILSDQALVLPINSKQLFQRMNSLRFKPVTLEVLNYFLQKLAAQSYISIKSECLVGGTSDSSSGGNNSTGFEVTMVEHSRVQSLYEDIVQESEEKNEESRKRKFEDDSDESSSAKYFRTSNIDKKIAGMKDSSNNTSDIMSLLSMPSTREKQNKLVGEEILELLSKPTAKERSLAEKFKSQGGAQVMEFCPHGTRVECLRSQQETVAELQQQQQRHQLQLQLQQQQQQQQQQLQQQQKQLEEISEIKKEIIDEETSTIVDKSDLTTIETKLTIKQELIEEDLSIIAGTTTTIEETSSNTTVTTGGGIANVAAINIVAITPNIKVPLEAILQCTKLHFKKIIQPHTDESLGDCSFLNTCFHMDTCKYVHYEVDAPPQHQQQQSQHQQQQQQQQHHHQKQLSDDNSSSTQNKMSNLLSPTGNNASTSHPIAPTATNSTNPLQLSKLNNGNNNFNTTANNSNRNNRNIALNVSSSSSASSASSIISTIKHKSIDHTTTLHPPQWIQCDLRFLDMTVLGKFAVIMADPPWDIHMELPYGTMSDDEMRQLGIPALQDDGLIFLWVTGRAMELGRECLKLWGYERFDELIWVKTNQLQRIIRTGRTGHWLNHGKEHCLVGTKGNPMNLNRGLDCDVIVAEVRATSHKPDEIYGIIERLSPGTRKIELFGRPHNVQPNWITLGNQLDGIRLVDPELISQFQKRYPDGNCMAPSQASSNKSSGT